MRRFTRTAYMMYFLGGMISVIFGAVMPEWLNHYHSSYAIGGLVVFLQACGFMLGVPVASFLMTRLHYRRLFGGAAVLVGIAQAVLIFTPPLEVVFVTVIVGGIGAAAIETAVASYVMEIFVGQRAIHMSRLEVSFGVGALVTPVISSLLIRLGVWQWSFACLAIVGFSLAYAWRNIEVNLHEQTVEGHLDAKTSAPPKFERGALKYAVLGLFLTLIFVYVGLEGSMNSFMPILFTSDLKASPANASLSVSTFWIAMVIGRIAISRMARVLRYEYYIFWSMLTAVVFLVMIALSKSIYFGFLFIFVTGLGMSAIYSLTMVYANHTFPGMVRTVTSLVTLCAGIGSAMLPGFTGYALDKLVSQSIPWIFVLYAGTLLVLLLAILATVRSARKTYPNTVENE